MKVCAFVVSVMLVVASSLLAQQQSLADVAKQEEQRRQAVTHASKVYTNGDVRPDTLSLPPSVIQAQADASRERPTTQPQKVENADGDDEHPSTFCETCPRTADGRIKRSAAAKHAFEVQTGYPHGRPGYRVDHIIALPCGGPDAPSNMQWQTDAGADLKDKTERKGCGRVSERDASAQRDEQSQDIDPIIDGTSGVPTHPRCKPEGANGNDARQQAMSNFMRDAGFPGPCSQGVKGIEAPVAAPPIARPLQTQTSGLAQPPQTQTSGVAHPPVVHHPIRESSSERKAPADQTTE